MSKNAQKWSFGGYFVFRLFQVFSGTFLQTPKEKTLLRCSAQEGPETPVNGRSGRKQKKKTLEMWHLEPRPSNPPQWTGFNTRLSEGFLEGSRTSAECKRGRRKGATSKNVKNRQKVTKTFSTLFDNFRAGQKTSKIAKKCQKHFRHFSTIFAQGKKRQKSPKIREK